MAENMKTESKHKQGTAAGRRTARRFYKKQLSSLKRGKAKPLGLFERLILKLTGRADGKRGLPLQENGRWRSPRLEAEEKTYHEFCSRMWGRLQLEVQGNLAEIRRLTDAIHHSEVLLAQARKDLAAATERMAHYCGIRRKGEEELTDAQVRRRREQEYGKILAPLQEAVRVHAQELVDKTEALMTLKSGLEEHEQSTHMVCRRVLDHTLLRCAAYWDAAVKHHPQQLPMTPALEIRHEAEEDYRNSSKQLFETAFRCLEGRIKEVV